MTSAELYAKAHGLDALADDVEVCVDAAWAVARSPQWECDSARGEARHAADRADDERAAVRARQAQ